ncbi:Neuropeptide-like protein C4orf48-like [Oryzias melastigma]|uniref:NELL2-interacting cell ontogeny regulator 1 n=1 Tax=Oryzias melastigma TaxID=30732 RepID=A0A834CFA8_ORYME|nr:Neuropeptide-like protein C4orf48-like [Oryzias melastigma]
MTEIPVPVPKRCKFELVLTHAHLVDVPQIALVCPLTVISTKHQWLIDCRDLTASSMASRGYAQAAVVLLAVQLVCLGTADADQETGTVIPAESRPCVDCHAFEFMQRALQDLKKTAFNLDARTETLVLRAERRALCDCMPVSSLR